MTRTYNRLILAVEGNKSELARGLGVSRSLIARMEMEGFIPERYALAAGELAERLAVTDDPDGFALQVLREARRVRGE